MGNIRRERRKQATFLKTLIIISIGVALLTTALIIMIREGNSPQNQSSYNI